MDSRSAKKKSELRAFGSMVNFDFGFLTRGFRSQNCLSPTPDFRNLDPSRMPEVSTPCCAQTRTVAVDTRIQPLQSFASERIPHVVKLVQESGATYVKAAQPAGNVGEGGGREERRPLRPSESLNS